MPHLVLCNRFWRLGGDELPIPAVCAIFGRVFWIVLLSILFMNTNTDNIDCHTSLDAYLGLSASVFLCSIMCEMLIAYSGMQGTIVETEKRNRPLEYYLFIHYLLAIVEVCCAIWGALIVSHVYRLPCSTDAVSRSQLDVLILTLVVVSQFVDTFLLGFCGWMLSSKPVSTVQILEGGYVTRGGGLAEKDALKERLPSLNVDLEASQEGTDGTTTSLTRSLRRSRSSGSTRQSMFDSTYDTYDEFQSQQQKVWAKRCSDLCKCMSISTCGIFGGVSSYQDIESVSKVLTQFFHHDGFLDVVPSDVIAGILLLRLQQRNVVKKLLGHHMHDRGSIRGVSDSAFLVGGGNEYREGRDVESLEQPTLTRSHSLVDTLSNRTRDMMTAKRRNLNKLSSSDWALTQDLYRMSLYAFAVYTHLLYLYTKPCSGLCTLCHRSLIDCTQDNCCQCFCGPSKHYTLASTANTPSGTNASREVPPKGSNVGDDCFHLNQSTVEAVLQELPGSEVLYASYRNDPTLKPYAIFADHSENKIVIAVRGTLSLEDCITDAICDSVELHDAAHRYPNGFVGENRYAHGGFYRSASRIREDITQLGILDSIYHTNGHKDIEMGNQGSPTNSSLFYTPGDWSHYQLVVVGHSLGAGVATILAMLLKGEYPSLLCYAFGAPGSTVDEITSQEIASYVTTIVLHNDMISRMSITSMNNIREQVLDTICRSKINKTQILQTLFRDLPIEDVLYTPGTEPPSDFKSAVDNFNTHMRQVNDHDVTREVVKLVIPGRIIHYVKSKDRKYSRQYNGIKKNGSELANGNGTEYDVDEKEVMDIYHEDNEEDSDPNEPCQECCCIIKCGIRAGKCVCCCCGPCMNKLCKADPFIPQETSLEAFAELIVSPSMAIDHFPDRYVFELKAVKESWKMSNIHGH